MGTHSMIRSLVKLAIPSALATGVLIFYLYPDASFIPNWIKSSLYSFPERAVNTGPSFGLKISLILVSFYLAQGFSALVKSITNSGKKASSDGQIPFHFLEIPTLLILSILGVAYIPSKAVQTYTTVLACLAPFLTLLELSCTMTVIMASGRYWSPKITESSLPVKLSVVAACFTSFGASFWVIGSIYKWMKLSTLVASLLSSIGTLAFVEVVAACRLEHATITDLSLMLPYISYNLVVIAWRSAQSLALERRFDAPFTPKSRLAFLSISRIFSWKNTPGIGLVRDAISTIFSPVLVFHLIFQLAIIVIASGAESKEDSECEDSTHFERLLNFAITRLWPLFGKSFLVTIYTLSWLDQSHPETLGSAFSSGQLPFFLDGICFWRWFVVYGALGWYGKHLVFDSDREQVRVEPAKFKTDRNLWAEFHNFRE